MSKTTSRGKWKICFERIRELRLLFIRYLQVVNVLNFVIFSASSRDFSVATYWKRSCHSDVEWQWQAKGIRWNIQRRTTYQGIGLLQKSCSVPLKKIQFLISDTCLKFGTFLPCKVNVPFVHPFLTLTSQNISFLGLKWMWSAEEVKPCQAGRNSKPSKSWIMKTEEAENSFFQKFFISYWLNLYFSFF